MMLRAMLGWAFGFAFSTSCAREGYKYSCRHQHRQMSQMSLTSDSKSLGNMFQIDSLWNCSKWQHNSRFVLGWPDGLSYDAERYLDEIIGYQLLPDCQDICTSGIIMPSRFYPCIHLRELAFKGCCLMV